MKRIISVLFIFLISIPAYAGTKIDPFLTGIYNAVNNLSLTGMPSMLSANAVTQTASGNILVDVLIRTTSPGTIKRFVKAGGGSTGTSVNGIITARIPLSMLYSLAQRQDCINISLSKRMYPLLDKSVPAVNGNIVHAGGSGLPRPYTGKDVIIGVVDTGIDLTHADMHYPDGSTKVIALWDQTTSGTPPNGYSYGNVCTGFQINAGKCNEQDTDGHGTHVTGIANSSNATYTGMAPDAMLVIVKTDMSEAHIIDGINYIFSLASLYNKPAVINLSLGAQYGPHDDSSSMEQALDGLVTQAPARAVAVAAGNDGGNPIHLGFTANEGSSYASYFSVVTNRINAGLSYLDLWYNTASPDLSFALGVINTSGAILAQTSFVSPGNTGALTLLSNGGTDYGYAQVDASNTASGGTKENEVALYITNNGNTSIDLTQSQNGFRFVLLIKNNGTSAQQLNAWIYTENSLFDTITSISVTGYSMVQGNTSDTVSTPATAKYAIAAGSFVTKTQWLSVDGNPYHFLDTVPIGDLSFFSSRGPSPAPSVTGQKPLIAAPGEVIVSSLSTAASFQTALITSDDTHVVLRGTSMASPHVAGAVALLFGRNNGLTITDTISLLESSATQDATTGTVPNNDWGYGKLNALALVQSAAATPSDTTPPVISGVTAITGTNTAAISWTTDELSSSHVKYWNVSTPGSWVSTGTTTMTAAHTVNLASLTTETTYAYQVISVDPMGNMAVYPSNGSGLNFTTGSAEPPASAPQSPTDLIAAAGNAQVTLTWNPSNGATDYRVYQSTTSGGPYTNTASTAGVYYTATGLTNNTIYYFVVTALNRAGESAYSNQASATPAGTGPAPAPGSKSAGCTCAQSGGNSSTGDLLPVIMLFIGWLAVLRWIKRENR